MVETNVYPGETFYMIQKPNKIFLYLIWADTIIPNTTKGIIVHETTSLDTTKGIT